MPGVNMVDDGPGQWQQVPKKKGKAEDTKKGASSKKTVSKGISGATGTDSVKSAFAALDQMNKREPHTDNEVGPLSSEDEEDGELSAKPSVEEKKIKKPKVKKAKITVSQAAEALEDSALTTFLHGLEESNPEDFDVQLRRCADFFERTFKVCELPFNKILQESPLSKSVETPLCDLPQDAIDKTRKWLSNRSATSSSQFALLLVREVLKGATTPSGKKAQPPKANVGLLMMLSLLLRAHPDALLQHAAALRPGPKNNSGEQFRLLLWCYGQVSKGAASAGVTLWVRNLLPMVLSTNSSSPRHELGLQFIENLLPAPSKARAGLLKKAGKTGGENAIVPITALLSFLSLAYASEEKPALRARALYPYLRELALAPGGRSGRTASLLLPPTMELAASAAQDSPLQSAVMDNLLWCLSSDPEVTLPLWHEQMRKFPAASPASLQAVASAWGCPETAGITPYAAQLLQVLQGMRESHRAALQSPSGLSSEEVARLRASEHAARVFMNKVKPGISFTMMAVVMATGVAAVAAGCAALSQHSLEEVTKNLSTMLPPDVSLKVATFLVESSQLCTESAAQAHTTIMQAVASIKM